MATSPIFLFGTLRHLPLLAEVSGERPNVVDAVLPGYRVHAVMGEDFPILLAEPGAQAVGLLAQVSDRARARLDYYEAPAGYALKPVTVDSDAGPVAAQVYLVDDSARYRSAGDWDLARWQDRFGAIATRAAPEIMAGQGRVAPHEASAFCRMAWTRAQAELNASEWRRPRSVGQPQGGDNVRIGAQHYDHLGFFTLETLEIDHARLHGGAPMQVRRTVFRAGEAVTVLPYDPLRDRVLLIEQFRVAPAVMTDPEPWLLEPVAGIVDPGESYEAAARRETREEAGIELKSLEFIARYYPSPGGTAQILHSYIGLADLPDGLDTSGGLDEEGEDLALHVVDFAHFMAMLESGELANAPTIMSAQFLAQHRPRLRSG